MIAVFMLAGCATPVPTSLLAPDNAVSFNTASTDLDAHQGEPVRWGGTIVQIENRATETRLEVLARPLSNDARPHLNGQSEGRFLVVYLGFLDPYLYTANRAVTVVGTLTGSETQTIGKFHYRYPVVQARTVHLWPKQVEQKIYDDPYYHDPWWPSPWYPWGYPFYYPYPYYRPPYWRY